MGVVSSQSDPRPRGDSPSTTGCGRNVTALDPLVASHYGLDLAALNGLERRIVDDYDPARWGIGRYASIDDVVDRAVASDLLISLCEGAKSALLHLVLASNRYDELLGPNGRTMPGPQTTLRDRIETAQMEAACTECFRALGSALDCLAGLSVLIAGIPLRVQRAEGSWLLRRPVGPPAPDSQETAWRSIATATAEEADIPEPGWLAWALETRNAVVHRGHLLRTWLTRPSEHRPGGPSFVVRTATPRQYLIRMEEHLRRRPWLPDMHALIRGGDIHDLWIAEPAQLTLRHLQRRVTELMSRVSACLLEIWESSMSGFEWPSAAWQLKSRDSGWRTELAEAFDGFDPDYPVPAPAELRMHADSAKRPALAERLRTIR
jgi:hypothetical protein